MSVKLHSWICKSTDANWCKSGYSLIDYDKKELFVQKIASKLGEELKIKPPPDTRIFIMPHRLSSFF